MRWFGLALDNPSCLISTWRRALCTDQHGGYSWRWLRLPDMLLTETEMLKNVHSSEASVLNQLQSLSKLHFKIVLFVLVLTAYVCFNPAFIMATCPRLLQKPKRRSSKLCDIQSLESRTTFISSHTPNYNPEP